MSGETFIAPENVAPDQFELTDGEKVNPMWLKLRRYFVAERQRYREKNDASLSPPETERVRGAIELLSRVIALGDTPQPID